MVTPEDMVLDALAVVAAIVYFTVARIQSQRPVSPEAKTALDGFILWWGGLGVVALAGVLLDLIGGLDSYGINGVRLVLYPLFAIIMVILAGLVHYLLYLYTGKQSTLYIAGAFYAFLFIFLLWLVEAHAPHIGPGHDGADAGFHLHEEPATWASAVFSLGLIVPALASALAYGLLFFRTTDRTARYRIAMVSGGFLLWFGYSTLGTVTRLATGVQEQGFIGQVVGQLLGVLAAVLVLLAYRPPRSLQRRFGLRAVEKRRDGPSPFEPPSKVQHVAPRL